MVAVYTRCTMGYRSLRQCVDDLQRTGQLIRIDTEIDPCLEAAEIQRRVYQAQGPAVFYANVKGCQFPMVSNLFGTTDRTRFIFRDAIEGVKQLVALKGDPMRFARHPIAHRRTLGPLWNMWPRSRRSGPAIEHTTTIDQLPQVKSWPNDGGAFVTLPAVYTQHPDHAGHNFSNLGMYRIQISGGRYKPNQQVGVHYQIHRSIGQHHAAAIRRGEPLKCNIIVGGPPAIPLSAVMPLPEGIPEFAFAGAIGRQPVRLIKRPGKLPIYAEADFTIVGSIDSDTQLPEGPFGDHLGYYSLVHNFPVLNVEQVYHRQDAIWPFTTVGRPPQEDTSFGEIIHEITGPAIPTVVPGVHAVHAVDAAGVHPLLLAIGSERYVPYAGERTPQELLTNANAILGQGQLSLAKYLLIVANEDNPDLDIHDIPVFFEHVLSRVDWRRDLHFQTQTTMDTLDYSGTGLNKGSKLVIAAAGRTRRELPTEIPVNLDLPTGYRHPHVCMAGVMAVEGPEYRSNPEGFDSACDEFVKHFRADSPISRFPIVLIVDNAEFTARTLNNWLWVTFTRSNPAADVYGIDSFTHQKHWGCRGAIVIDARIKPHHAPPLIEDAEVTRRVDQLAAKGGPLHGIL
jgi:4-hydroxy-3-polyprenylbenzoate decarboxylase